MQVNRCNTIRQMAIDINNELDRQDKMLDEVNRQMDKVQEKLESTTNWWVTKMVSYNHNICYSTRISWIFIKYFNYIFGFAYVYLVLKSSKLQVSGNNSAEWSWYFLTPFVFADFGFSLDVSIAVFCVSQRQKCL